MDFCAFAQAFELYIKNNNREARKNLKSTLTDIVNFNNSKRTNFHLPPSHQIVISREELIFNNSSIKPAYLLLAFIEGDGTFSLSQNNNLVFSIGQKGNKALLEAIKKFLI